MSVKIIAEAGSNHNGDVNHAFKLVDIACQSGADFVKFQIIDPDSLYVPFYWDDNEKIVNQVYERRKKECLTFNQWRQVYEYSKKKGIEFTASVFDIQGVDFLKSLKVPFVKLASSDLNNKRLIKYISKTKLPLIMSTGMASIDEVKTSVDLFTEFSPLSNLSVLHCVSVYPCLLENTSLHKIKTLKNKLRCDIGFSDHTMSSKAACVAVSLGATILEKHFTIDKEMDGFDHKYASSPNEFLNYVDEVRAIEKSLDNYYIQNSEENVTKIRARRGVYLNKQLKKGHIIEKDDLVALRPQNKLNPIDIDSLIGIKLGEDIRSFESMKLMDNQLYKDRNFSWRSANDYWNKEMKEKKMKN